MFFASSAGIPPVAIIAACLLWAAPQAHADDALMAGEPQAAINGLPAQGSQQGVIVVERERTSLTLTVVSAVDRERETLALIVNRLAHIGQQADATGRTVRSNPPQNTRYHFDYALFAADLRRMQAGIHAYLNPTRTQPRDVGELPADYTRERDAQ